jgi:hypothetical protein
MGVTRRWFEHDSFRDGCPPSLPSPNGDVVVVVGEGPGSAEVGSGSGILSALRLMANPRVTVQDLWISGLPSA